MSTLFNRVAKVNIGGREFSYPPFSIEFTQEQKIGNLQSATLKLYNPSPETIQVFEAKKKGSGKIFPKVTVSAGYKEDSGTVVLGEAINYSVSQNGVERILEVKISDSTTKWSTAIVNKSYKKSSAVSVIKDACKSIGIDPGEIELGENKTYDSITVRGFSDSIRKIAADTKSEFYFRNGLLTLQPKNSKKKQVTLLNSYSGLLDKPEKTAKGYKIKTLFLYSLCVGMIVKIESKDVNLTAKIVKGTKNFSTFGDANCEFEVIPA
ncbi:hypothetical protein CH352_14420 [Leptospira hartskeerlii]|uniref:Uncharacterized protein n=1 Tax=Leptospira hartskeerlii TaxID=2023177 RepID=A0A2M9X9N0_9LEPT|nr:hypothetical protein [Leptospira hartskeerlii]PJZ24401.1 hypothetical protein CH357_15085 [Leptospira hartskeerlii]PJZ32987.1 hypothetical protein CH352_14420 [Leptospira hartskeerlii]